MPPCAGDLCRNSGLLLSGRRPTISAVFANRNRTTTPHVARLPAPGPESLPLGAPASLDSLLAYDITLLDPDTDLSLLAVPLLPLPDDLLFLPVIASEQPLTPAERPSPQEPLPPVASPPRDLSREGPLDAFCDPSDTGDHPLISDGLPGCPYRMTSYARTDIADVDPVFGLQLHHPRFLEYIGAPELQFQHDASLMTSNLQVLGQFVTSLNRMSSEVLRLAFGPEVFPSEAVNVISPVPRAHRAAHYMSAMGLWRPPGGPGIPGPLPVSSCNDCMKCYTCFPGLSSYTLPLTFSP